KTAFWWLEHYSDFSRHLQRRYRMVARDEKSCILYSLRDSSTPGVELEELEKSARAGGANSSEPLVRLTTQERNGSVSVLTTSLRRLPDDSLRDGDFPPSEIACRLRFARPAKDLIGNGFHRSGWPYAVESLRLLEHPQ